MKKRLTLLFISLLLVFSVLTPSIVNAQENQTLYLGGMPAGFSIETRGATIVGLTDVITKNGLVSPSKDAELLVGDVILSIDGKDINNAKDIAESLTSGSKKILIISRNDKEITIDLTPAKDLTNNYKLGVFVRDNVSGIGTITYYLGDTFASLGHPVINENGRILQITGGQIFNCDITGYKRGERGNPGELHGIFSKSNGYAKILKNNECGVFGKITEKNFDYKGLTQIEKGEAQMGKASIFTTLDGSSPQEYSISIVKIDQNEKTKNFVIKVNDKRLLDTTGGIVQGMSGSPIVQNGKLIGAVTHVFINDPTRGFGIDIDNMLNA